jgi:hypothetical protein
MHSLKVRLPREVGHALRGAGWGFAAQKADKVAKDMGWLRGRQAAPGVYRAAATDGPDGEAAWEAWQRISPSWVKLKAALPVKLLGVEGRYALCARVLLVRMGDEKWAVAKARAKEWADAQALRLMAKLWHGRA